MAMVVKATITVPLGAGDNFALLDKVRKILAQARDEVEAAVGKGGFDYETLANVRASQPKATLL